MPRLDELVTSDAVGEITVPKRLFTNLRTCPVCKTQNLKTSKKCKKCGCEIGKFFTI